MVELMSVGDPQLQVDHVGPVVSARQRSVIESYSGPSRRTEGAKAVVGGGRPQALIVAGSLSQPCSTESIHHAGRARKKSSAP